MSTALTKQGMCWAKVTCLCFLFCDKLLSGLLYFHDLEDKIDRDKPSRVFLQHIEQRILMYYHRVFNNLGGDWTRQPTQSILEPCDNT